MWKSECGRRNRGQKTEKLECGLRPVGAIEAYAPEGRWNRETDDRETDDRETDDREQNFQGLAFVAEGIINLICIINS